MGRGGGGGGSRSSGGGSRGGSRSSGGFHGGGGSSHRGGMGSSRPHSSSSSFSGSSFRPRRSYGGPPRPVFLHQHYTYRPAGCLTQIVAAIALIVVIAAILIAGVFAGGGGSGGITPSTIQREKLPPSAVNETAYFEDHIGWITSASKLEAGLKKFYQETGIQPYLYITEDINGNPTPSEEEMDAFAYSLYDQLFTDEGHLLVIFQEYQSDGNYYAYYMAGMSAKTIFDNEAADILFDYLDHYYYSDMDEETFFATAFEKTAERMMTVTRNPIVYIVIALIVLAIVVVLFAWWRAAQKRKQQEREEMERILSTPVGGAAEDPTLQQIEDKYTDS